MARLPSHEKTTALVARALQRRPDELVAAFRPAREDELPQLLALRQRIFGTALHWDDRRYIAWRYHFGAPEHGRGECWVVAFGDEVLAMLGSEQIVVHHQGRAVPALSVMDIAVRPELEGIGLGVWMAQHLCARSACVLAIGSNVNSRAIVTRVFTRVPDRRSYAHLVDFGPMLARRWKAPLVARAGALLAGWGMAAWRGGVGLLRRRDVALHRTERFDAAIEPLIEASRAPDELVIGRDAAFLNWRLFDNPRSRYTVWGARQGDRWLGYVAVRRCAPPSGPPSLVIEDLLVRADADGAAARGVLLHRALQEAVAQGCERVSIIACHAATEQTLRQFGFFAHRADAETLSVNCNDAPLAEAIAAGAPWHLTGANTDRDE